MRLLPILLLVAALPLSADDQSDFSTVPDGTWQRFDPRADAGLAAYGLPTATYDFSGNQCRIIAPQPLTEAEYYAAQGLARAGLFAPTDFSDAVASVDITAWSPTTVNRYPEGFVDGTFIGVFTRAQSPVAAQNVNGYSASIIDMGEGSGTGPSGRNGQLQLMLVINEGGPDGKSFYLLGDRVDFQLDPTHDYRLVLASRGEFHTARVFDLSNSATLVAETMGQDDTFPTGKTGIMILTDRIPYVTEFSLNHSFIDVTFDNFLAWDGTPPPLLIQPGTEPGTLALSSDLHRALATDLQGTTNFTDPLTPWQPATPASVSVNGNQLVTIFPIDGPRRFFRRKSL